jgi:hypothetical protein
MSVLNQSLEGFFGSNLGNIGAGKQAQELIARVTHIVRGPLLPGTNIPDRYYTDPTSLGDITFQLLSDTQSDSLASGNQTAKPIHSGFKQYPLEGEIVFLIAGPSIGMNESREQRSFFYLPPYNLWNASHHNAFPDLGDYSAFVGSIQRTYEQSEQAGQPVNTSATGSLTFPLGPNFIEKPNIKSLRQFTGDVTLEGRWGNSIRLSSTTLSLTRENPWSSDSEPGNPITIIRNGQGRTVDSLGWIPTVEDINTDPSSIYLTQGQKIVIDDINKNFSLASLQVGLQTTKTAVTPIQQQLTSTDTTSAQEQDNFTYRGTETTTPSVINQNTEVPAEGTPATQQTLTVVGDVQDLSIIDGTYVVSLRTVDNVGNIINSASSVKNTAEAAYDSASRELRAKNTNIQLVIPLLSSLSN